jgi:hypothetical protein
MPDRARRVLPAVLAAVVVGAAVLLALASRSADEGSPTVGQEAAEQRARENPPPPAEVTAPGAAEAPADPGALEATLVAGGRAYLPLPSDGLRSAVDEEVTGDALIVLSVTKTGFMAGGTGLDRVYVSWYDRPPVVRTQVDVQGVVRPAPDDPRRQFGLEPGDAATVAAAGGYIEASEVSGREDTQEGVQGQP